MSFAIVPMVPNISPRGGGVVGARPLALDYGGHAIRLGPNRALGWTPDDIPDARVNILCDDRLDTLSAGRRAHLQALVPDRTIPAGARFHEIIGNMLKNPPDGAPWNPLTPHVGRGQLEILLGPGNYLGPGDSNPGLLWSEQADVRGPHSQSLVDTFNRANAALDGSLSSDGLFTWNLIYAAPLRCNIVSNQVVITRAGAIETDESLVPSVPMDTPDHSASIVVSLNGTKDYAGPSVRLKVGDYGATDTGYGIQLDIGFNNEFALYDNRTPNNKLASVGSGGATSGTVYLQIIGSSYLASRNGIVLLSGTDMVWTGAVGERKVGWVAGVYINNSDTVTLDNFAAADFPVTTAQATLPNRSFFDGLQHPIVPVGGGLY